jgi:hypothetical protein
MTGEMGWIKPDGTGSNGDCYPIHAAVAKAMRCTLRPFDVYCGPYIAHRKGRVWLEAREDGSGAAVLWPGGVAPAYCEPVVVEFFPFNDKQAAIAAARKVVK